MRFLPTSYADFLTIAKSLETTPGFGYFPLPAQRSFFVWAYLPTSTFFVAYVQGDTDAENFPAFTTDMPGAVLLHGTLDFEGTSGQLIQVNSLTDMVNLVGMIPNGKVLFGIDANDGDLEAFSVGGSFVLHFEQTMSAETFLTAFPNAIQLLDQVTFSAEFE